MVCKKYLIAALFTAALMLGGRQAAKAQSGSDEFWKDSATGLTWTAKNNDRNVNATVAQEYCSGLRLGGFSDWRLPTVDELEGIYDARSSKMYKTKGPIQLDDSCILSSSTNNSGEIWSFCFNYGGKSLRAPSGHGSAARVLCVRK